MLSTVPLGITRSNSAKLQSDSAVAAGPGVDLHLVALHGEDDMAAVVVTLSRLDLGRVGVSSPFYDLDGIRTASTQSITARNVGVQGGGSVTLYDRAEIGNLVVDSPRTARRLHDRILREVNLMPEAEQDILVETLRMWFASNGSTETTAGRLHCHPNTVRYRLNKLQSRLGRDLKRPIDLVELYVALEVRRLLPQAPTGAE